MLAAQLRGAGVAAFPCWARQNVTTGRWDKGPAVPRGESWQVTALRPFNDPALDWSSGVVGVPIPPGVVVLDLDTYKGVTRADVERFFGVVLPWDAALIQRTLSGGEHYAFRCDWPVRQGVSIGMSGLDTRAAGKGFICTGAGYTPVGFGCFALAHPSALPVFPDALRPALEKVEHTAPERPPVVATADDVEVMAALRHVDPGCLRMEWLSILMALRAGYVDDEAQGLELAERWSAGEFWHGGTPANYVPEDVARQWRTLKPDGATTIATLFYKAIQGGWAPPRNDIDTARAFGSSFDDLVERVRTTGGDVLRTQALVDEIRAAGCSALQVALLAAELKLALRDAGVKDAAVGKTVDLLLAVRMPAARQPGAVPAPGAVLDPNTPLHPSAWVPMHTKGKENKPKGTLANFDVMLQAYGVSVSFDEITRDVVIRYPSQVDGVLRDEAAYGYIESLCALNEFPATSIASGLSQVAHSNTVNPVRVWVESRPWDGRDRFPELLGQFVFAQDEDVQFAALLVRKWLRGAIAIGTGFTRKMEYVLVLIDPEGGAGKTRFFNTLAPADLIKDSLVLDLTNKDSIKTATSCWLGELGELDGTFRKSDQAKLKAFLSQHVDEIRLPYGRTYNKYPRRTAYSASINTTGFFVDDSDNRRFWPIRVQYANHLHTIDTQQLWAQMLVEVRAGASWWPEGQEIVRLREHNDGFRAHSRVVECLAAHLRKGEPGVEHLTVTEIVTRCGFFGAHKADLNEAAAWLRRSGFERRKRGGCWGYVVPAITPAAFKPPLSAVS